MLVRYSGSVGAAAAVTAALIYWMQLMIATGEVDITARPALDFRARLYEITAPPPPPPPEDLPAPPEPRSTPPGNPTASQDPTGPTEGLVIPSTPPAQPRPGFGLERGDSDWSGDGDLMVLARIQAVYPHLARTRGLEGHVVVEFTVTEQGTVRDARIVESSDRVFDRSALAAVARFRYRPRFVDGSPVSVQGVRTEFAFRLED